MTLVRSMSLALRVLVGTSWAACLVVLGLVLLFDGLPFPLVVPRLVCALVGVTFIGMGLFLFMAYVADRLVPSVGRRQSMWPLEMFVASVFVLSFGAALLVLLYGGSSA